MLTNLAKGGRFAGNEWSIPGPAQSTHKDLPFGELGFISRTGRGARRSFLGPAKSTGTRFALTYRVASEISGRASENRVSENHAGPFFRVGLTPDEPGSGPRARAARSRLPRSLRWRDRDPTSRPESITRVPMGEVVDPD